MHEVIASSVDPLTALSIGIKVDSDALPPGILATADLTSPATTVALIGLGAVGGQRRDARPNPFGPRYERGRRASERKGTNVAFTWFISRAEVTQKTPCMTSTSVTLGVRSELAHDGVAPRPNFGQNRRLLRLFSA